MGATKKQLFTDQQNLIATLAKALAHPARVAIIEHLLTSGNCICTDFIDAIPLAQPTIAQHLKVLRSSGLLHEDVHGNYVSLYIDEQAVHLIENYLISISTQLSSQFPQSID